MTEIVAKMKPWHKDVMDRLIAGHDIKDIAKDLSMNVAYLQVIARSPLFQNEMKLHREIALKAVTERLEGYAQEALSKIVEKMRSSKIDSIQLSAAREILDRSGHVKPESNTDVVHDAEEVIKALQRMKNAEGRNSGPVNGAEDGDVQQVTVRNDSAEADIHTGRSGLVSSGESIPGQCMGEAVHPGVDGEQADSLPKEPTNDDDVDNGVVSPLAGYVPRGS